MNGAQEDLDAFREKASEQIELQIASDIDVSGLLATLD